MKEKVKIKSNEIDDNLIRKKRILFFLKERKLKNIVDIIFIMKKGK